MPIRPWVRLERSRAPLWGVLELAVAPSSRDQEPAGVVKQAEQITHFRPPTLDWRHSPETFERNSKRQVGRLTIRFSGEQRECAGTPGQARGTPR